MTELSGNAIAVQKLLTDDIVFIRNPGLTTGAIVVGPFRAA
jgi:hypothetical protein